MTNAITVIGLKMPWKKFLVEEVEYINEPNCLCEVNNPSSMKYCSECGKKNNVVKNINKLYVHKIILSRSRYEGFIDIKGGNCEESLIRNGDRVYSLYKEKCDHQSIYVSIWQGSKSGSPYLDPMQIVTCPFSLENLLKEQKKMKTFFISKKILDEEEFDTFFGIRTLIET